MRLTCGIFRVSTGLSDRRFRMGISMQRTSLSCARVAFEKLSDCAAISVPAGSSIHAGIRACARLLACAGLLVCAVISGCAGPQRLENPADWPPRWDDRVLCTTEAAFVYARSGWATDEINRLMTEVAADFERDAGAPPPPVAVIVRDTGDAAWPMETEAWLLTCMRVKAALAPKKNVEPSDQDEASQEMQEARDEEQEARDEVGEALQDAKDAMEETGVDMDVLVEMMALPCDRATLREGLGAPEELAECAPTVLVVPTKALVRRNARKILKGALEKEDIGPVAQVFLAPLLAIVEAKLVDALSAMRNAAVYEYWAYTCAQWTDEEKTSHVKSYEQSKMSEVMPGLLPAAVFGQGGKKETDVDHVEYFDKKRESEQSDVEATTQPTVSN